jgi:hypothetical protein
MRRFGYFGDAAAPPMPGAPPMPMQAPMPGNLPQDQWGPYSKQDRFWFTYQTPNIASIAAGAAATNAITFDNDSAFEWTKTTYTVDLTNHATGITASGQATGTATAQDSIVVPFVTLQIQDTGQGSYYSNAAIPVYQIAGGQPGFPYVMPAPQIIAPNATLQFNWLSFSTAGGGNETYNNLRLQLHGWKIRRGAAG